MIICTHCGAVMRPKQTGVIAVEHIEGRPYRVWSADRMECPWCRTQVFAEFGKEPLSRTGYEDFEDWQKLAMYTFNGDLQPLGA